MRLTINVCDPRAARLFSRGEQWTRAGRWPMKPKQRKTRAASLLRIMVAVVGSISAAPVRGEEVRGGASELGVAWGEGGTGAIVGQPLTEKMTALLGQPVKLEYRPGASGAVGTQSVARAAPD